MPGNPFFNQLKRLGEHDSIFGQVIKQERSKLITQRNLSSHDDLFLDVVKALVVKAWHVQDVLERSSDSGVRWELFDFFVHVFVGFGGFYIQWTDEVFAPFFDVSEANWVGERSAVDENALDHFESRFLLLFVIFI